MTISANDVTMRSINEPDAPVRDQYLGGSHNEPVTVPEDALNPQIDSLDPAECTIGDPSFTMEVHGTGFYPGSVIVFASRDEPTTHDAEAGTLSTGINMDVWHGPDVVKVSVRNGPVMSNEEDFTFNAGPARTSAKQDEADRAKAKASGLVDDSGDYLDPDELEEELEEAEDEGEFVSTHKPRGKK